MRGRSTAERVLAVLDEQPRDVRSVYHLVARDGRRNYEQCPSVKVVRVVLGRLADVGQVVVQRRDGDGEGGAVPLRRCRGRRVSAPSCGAPVPGRDEFGRLVKSAVAGGVGPRTLQKECAMRRLVVLFSAATLSLVGGVIGASAVASGSTAHDGAVRRCHGRCIRSSAHGRSPMSVIPRATPFTGAFSADGSLRRGRQRRRRHRGVGGDRAGHGGDVVHRRLGRGRQHHGAGVDHRRRRQRSAPTTPSSSWVRERRAVSTVPAR